jgi:GAF domain-containing protein/signal transduction histidine kinase
MDATLASPLTHGWELMAELARCGRDRAPDLDAQMLTRHLVAMLQQYLQSPWGLLALVENERIIAYASWGLSNEEATRLTKQNGHNRDLNTATYIELRVGSTMAGYLLLARPGDTHALAGPAFYDVLAAQLGLILNARNRRHDHIHTTTHEIITGLARRLQVNLAPDNVAEIVFASIQSLISWTAARICLYDVRQRSFRVVHYEGFACSADIVDDACVRWLADNQQTLRQDDIQADSAVVQAELVLEQGEQVCAYLGVPLQINMELIGTLELFSRQPGAFSTADEQFLVMVAEVAAQALSSASRYTDIDENFHIRIEQLRALQRVSSQLAITVAQENILEFVLNQALQATYATHGIIALRASELTSGATGVDAPDNLLKAYFSSEGHEVLTAMRKRDGVDSSILTPADQNPENGPQYLVVEAAGYSASEREILLQHPINPQMATAYQALQSGEPVLTDALIDQERVATHYVEAGSALAAPIFYQAGVVGVVLLLAPQEHGFDHDAIEFVRALAHQAAVAIGSAQRYAELEQVSKLLQRRASILHDVLEIGQALRADRLLAEILEEVGYSVMETADFRAAIFSLTDAENSANLRIVAGAGIPLSELADMKQAVFPKELVLRYLDDRFRIGRSFFVPVDAALEIEQDFDTIPLSYHSFDEERAPDEWQRGDRLFVPLYSTDGRMLGIMTVSDPLDRKRPDNRTVEPLEIFADQAAIAIENHYLLRDARAQAEQMAALYQVGSAATSTVDLDVLLERVYQGIVEHLGVPSFFFISTYLPERDQISFDLFMQEGEILERYHKQIIPKSGLTGHIIDSGEPLLIRDSRNENPILISKAVSLGEEVRSWLGVPLRIQNRILGVLSIQHCLPDMFSDSDLRFLTALANQLAIAIENASLFQERERRIAELDIINRIGNITSSTLDLPQMLNQVYDCLADFLPIDAFFTIVYRSDPSEISLSLEIANGVRTIDMLPRALKSESLTECIVQTRQPLLFDDLQAAQIGEGLQLIEFGKTTHAVASWLGVPLLIGDGEVVGVISVQSYEKARYGEREQSFLSTVANQLALGVQNAQLLAQAQEQVQHLALLNRVSATASSTLELERIYQAVVEAMAQTVGADQSRLVMYDRDAGIAPIVAEYIPTDVPERIAIQVTDNPAIDWLDTELRPLFSSDVQHDPLFRVSRDIFRELDIGSIALVPLILGGEVIGCVGLDFVARQVQLSPQRLELCQTIANQTTTVIANARLFAEAQTNANALQVKVGELSTLLDAARILSSLLRPDQVLDRLMDLVGRQLGVTTVALWTIGGDNVMIPAAMDGIPAEVGREMRVPVGQGLTGKVAETGMPLIINDVQQEGDSLYPDFQRKHNLVSFLGVPVVYRERIIGVLSVMTNQRRVFNDDEMMLLVGLADQAATALENARLFQERERRISELTTINKISNAVNATLDLNDLLDQLHYGISEILDVRTSLIALYDEQSQMLSYPIVYDEGQRTNFAPAPLLSGSNAWVIRNRQSLLIRSFDEAVQMGLDTTRGRKGRMDRVEQSFLVTPIIFGDHVLGVINIQSYDIGAFDENDLRFLMTVANQAAVAINNAYLFGQIRQNADEMRALYEVSVSLAGTLDPEEVQCLVATAVCKLLDAESCAVITFDDRLSVQRQILADRSGLRDDLSLPIRDEGWTRRLFLHDQPLAIADVLLSDNPNPKAVEMGLRSMLGKAIGPIEEHMGAIWVGLYAPHTWTTRQISLLSILANQAGQALQSAQLFQREQSRRRMADTLRDVAQSFTSTLALREIQTLILDQLAWVVPYDKAAVLLRDEGYGYLHITEARGLDTGAMEDTGIAVESDLLFNKMAVERQPVLIEEVTQDSRFALLAQMGWDVHTWIGAPLLVDNELVGVLAVGSNTPGVYDDEAVEVTFTLASQASQAIHNARLFGQISNLAAELERRVIERTAELSQEKDRLEAVHQITLELTAMLDLDQIINRALAMVSTNMGVARGSIMLKEQQTGNLICRAVLYDQGDVRSVNIPISFQGSSGLAGWVMQYQEPVCIADVRRDKRWVLEAGRADDVRSVAAVPLKTTDTTLGVLILSSPKTGYFTDSQIWLLGTIANEVAIAINNATLYEWIDSMAARLSELLEQQREENSKSRAILQSVTEGVIVLDEERKITLFNRAAEQVLDIPATAVLEHPLDTLVEIGEKDEERKRTRQIYNCLRDGLEQAKKSQDIYSRSLDLSNPTQIILVNLAPVIGPNDQSYGSVAVLRDITREIESDRAKRQFISDVSHELRTPLTAIKGYVDVLLLSSTGGLTEEQINYLGIVKTNTNRLKALIDDILDISRIEDGRIQLNFNRVDVHTLISDVVQSLRLEAERKSMAVILDVSQDLPKVEVDQKRITQVISNLYSNALKYTYEHGRIVIRAFLNRADLVQFEIEDNGVGMSPEQRQKLFRPFYRADNPLREAAGGTGLGLSIAKSLVEQHGGEMWVTGELGKGSTFSFIIPLRQSETHHNADGDDE